MVAACSPAVVDEFSQKYGIGVRGVDQVLCQFNETYQAFLSGKVRDTTMVFFWTLPVMAFATLLESTRSDRSKVASYPVILGILYQTITGGLAISVFWGLFLWNVRPGSRTLARAPVTRVDAEAALVAVIVGYYIPTVWMTVTKDPLAVVVWQPFPIYMSLVQHLVRRVRDPGPGRQSELGLQIVRIGFAITSTIATVSYIYAVLPHLSETIVTDFIEWLPSLTIPDPKTTTISSAALHLIQYDVAMSLGSAIVAAILLLPSAKDQTFISEAAPMVLAVAGPGIIIGGLWVFREELLVKRYKYLSEKAKQK